MSFLCSHHGNFMKTSTISFSFDSLVFHHFYQPNNCKCHAYLDCEAETYLPSQQNVPSEPHSVEEY